MTTRTIEIATPDGLLDGRLSIPAGEGPWPGVLVLPDILGPRPVTDEMAERLAELGFAVLVPNLYYRIGPAPVPDLSRTFADPAFLAEMKALAAQATPDERAADLAAALDSLAALPEVGDSKLAVVGYCIGGRYALQAAALFPDRVGVAASFHGSELATEGEDSPHLDLGQVQARLYFAHATDDRNMPADAIARLETALAGTGLTWESEVYDAAHGFAVPGMRAFDEAAAERHWRALETLLVRT